VRALSPPLFAVTGLTHRRSCRDLFATAAIKALAVLLAFAIFYGTGGV